MIINKTWKSKPIVTVEHRSDILITLGHGNGEVILLFEDSSEVLDLDSGVSPLHQNLASRTTEPEVVLSFTDPRSIDNLIALLKQGKGILESLDS